MRKEMHWSLAAGALLALALSPHQIRLPLPVVAEVGPAARVLLHELLLPGRTEAAERSE